MIHNPERLAFTRNLREFVSAKIQDLDAHKSSAVLEFTWVDKYVVTADAKGWTIKNGDKVTSQQRIASPLTNLQAMLVWVEDQTHV